MKDGIIKIHKMENSSQEGENIVKSNKWTSLLLLIDKFITKSNKMDGFIPKDEIFKWTSASSNDEIF